MDPAPVKPSASVLGAMLPGVDGTNRSIAGALSNGPALMVIYKSSCAASKVLLPVLQRIHNHHQSDGLTTLAVSQDSANIAKSFARRYGITFQILVESAGFPISNGFGIQFTPSVFVLRRDGEIAYTTMGFLRGQVADIEAAVAAELGVVPASIIAPEETEIPFFVPG